MDGSDPARIEQGDWPTKVVVSDKCMLGFPTSKSHYQVDVHWQAGRSQEGDEWADAVHSFWCRWVRPVRPSVSLSRARRRAIAAAPRSRSRRCLTAAAVVAANRRLQSLAETLAKDVEAIVAETTKEATAKGFPPPEPLGFSLPSKWWGDRGDVAEITKRMGEMSTCVVPVLACLRRRARTVACLTTASAILRSANAIIA
jgi:hypothetical protein